MFNSPGAICEQFVKCGKAGCRCESGELHGPYHYLFYRDDLGKQRKKYIKRGSVEAERERLAIKKAADASLQPLLGSINPPKRKRNCDFMTGIGRTAMALDRFFNGPLHNRQPRDEAGRFTKS